MSGPGTGTNYKRAGFGLGLFSIALGVTELLGARRIARALSADGHEGWIKGFGVRELAAGAVLLKAPADATGVWSRVAGDIMDLTALGVVIRRAPRNPAAWGALAFVAGATMLDIFVARGLDRTTGPTFPSRA